MKRILGLDLGTNSIGWALISEEDNNKKILGIGSRIIPMSQDILGEFDRGNSISQTAERTRLRGVRRLRERQILRRERMHRVLKTLGFLPQHYEEAIDFKNQPGKYIEGKEPKLAWKLNGQNKYEFLFKESFDEMILEFKNNQPDLLKDGGLIPYDWTIYYLRKKALTKKIKKEELAWILLNFNQKRGYYQLRGEEVEKESNKIEKFYKLRVVDVQIDDSSLKKSDKWYNLFLENGWVYRRSSNTPLFDWKDKLKEFIVTTEINEDGTIKTYKDGKEKRSFRAPKEDDWALVKKKTEFDIDNSGKKVGEFVFDHLITNPSIKIKGNLVRTIERKYYKEELTAILTKQLEFHEELRNRQLYSKCLDELYPNNDSHKGNINSAGFLRFFIDDILFYQRPLKSKKSLISNCQYESRSYVNKNGIEQKVPVKCIARSHPAFQEFRLWQFISNLRIYEKERLIDGKLVTDVNVTSEFLKTEDDYVKLFEWLNSQEKVNQKALLKSPLFGLKKQEDNYRWNYVVDKEYPCNETRSLILKNLKKINQVSEEFLDKKKEFELWHILYSVEDKLQIESALNKFALRYGLDAGFVDVFKKFPRFNKEYGAYSLKAINKLLPLLRMGKYWNQDEIHRETQERINKIINGEHDDAINNRVREKSINLRTIEDFKALPLWLACYIVYGRHSEVSDLKIWKSPNDIDNYLRNEFKQHSLRNPIVEQVITETLRVVRDIWKRYGEIDEIHLELGREMKNDSETRKNLSKKNIENENTNLRIKALLMELKNDGDIENVRPFSPSQQEILKIYEEGALGSEVEIPDDISKISKLAIPSKKELEKYKLWLEQKYRSPYTGEIISITKLFTSAYQIEHIIPQSRYFDDSLSNKVICESVVNANPYKDNQLGYEFIKNNSGRIVTELSQNGHTVRIFTKDEYEDFVKKHYSKTRAKMKKLLLEEIPEDFIERQLNDSRYISRYIKGLLSNIVREDGEEEAVSKNLIPCTGGITNALKQDWGLNDVWNSIISPRFERLNQLTNSNKFGEWRNIEGKRVFQIEVPLELQKGFNKKRIDHRHHALDALVIACATRSHINYLNNESAKPSNKEQRYDLKHKLCFKTKPDNNGNYQWRFKKPWDTFTEDAKSAIGAIVVSFKKNVRVINKSTNYYQKYIDGKKVFVKQTKGDNWAIRKSLHKDTVAGLVNLKLKKQVALSIAIDSIECIVDKNLKSKIKQLKNTGIDKKGILKYFKELDNVWMGKSVSKPEIYYFTNEQEKDKLVANRVFLDTSFNEQKIETITDKGIQKILVNHLKSLKYNGILDENGKEIPPEMLAFSHEGIEDMNKNIIALNGGIPHKPIYKVRVSIKKGKKFIVGTKGCKNKKYVGAEDGTNLFFTIYADSNGKRKFETIPLFEVIEKMKQGIEPVSPQKIGENGEVLTLQLFLNPNDLIYLPTESESNSLSSSLENIDRARVYRFIDSSDTTANFVPVCSAKPIFSMNKNEQNKLGFNHEIQDEYGLGSPQSKNQKAITGEMIKESCIKIIVDRLGNICLKND